MRKLLSLLLFLSVTFAQDVNDKNFKEKDRFNLRCRLPEGEIPQAMALIVNKTNVNLLTKANLSHYKLIAEVEKIFKKWSPAIFLGWSNIGFDDEMIRK